MEKEKALASGRFVSATSFPSLSLALGEYLSLSIGERRQQKKLLLASTPKIVKSTIHQRVFHSCKSSTPVCTTTLKWFATRRVIFLFFMALVAGLLVKETSAELYLIRSNMNGLKKCKVHVNLPLHVVMDRVCELCHDFYSHENPNMRMECRSNCFRSEKYKKCLHLFKPSISSDHSTSTPFSFRIP